MELDDLRRAVRDTLLGLALTSTTPAGRLEPRRGQPGSRAPRGQDSPATAFAAAATAAWDDQDALAVVLDRARAELRAIRKSPDAPAGAVNETEFMARAIELGAGWSAHDVALALRTSEGLVRRWRCAAGRDPENGRELPPEIANGKPVAFATELVLAGYSLRQAALLAGVPKSTVTYAVKNARARS